MESIVLGLLGAGIGAGLFCLGLATGVRLRAGGGGSSARGSAETAGGKGEVCTEPQAEEKRLREEQEAFAALMRYSADTAYGSRGN